MANPFVLISPATRGLSLALARHYLRSTDLPVYATHRTENAADVHAHILATMPDIDPKRLNLLSLDLAHESSIERAASTLKAKLPDASYIHTAFFTGGILHPERQPADIDAADMLATFKINVMSHLLLIKHFSPFLPTAAHHPAGVPPAKWVHVSARVGSISDNRQGGWYSYRASKAALNQVIRTFDNHLQMRRTPGICVGVHPGTVKTDLSKDFWGTVPKGHLFEPEQAAEKLVHVVADLTKEQRGKVWDYAGIEVPW